MYLPIRNAFSGGRQIIFHTANTKKVRGRRKPDGWRQRCDTREAVICKYIVVSTPLTRGIDIYRNQNIYSISIQNNEQLLRNLLLGQLLRNLLLEHFLS